MKLINAEKLKERIRNEVPERARKGFLKQAFDGLLADVIRIIDDMPEEKTAKKRGGAKNGNDRQGSDD